MRILLWSPKGAGLHYGGAGMNAFRLYSTDHARRFSVSLYHGYKPQAAYPIFDAEELVHPLRGSISDQVRFVVKGRKVVRRVASEFDVFHGLGGYSVTMEAAVAAEDCGLPAVLKLAGSRGELVDKPGWRRWLAMPRRRRVQLLRLSAVVAISSAIREELLEYGLPEESIACIPNGVDVDVFKPCVDSGKDELRGRLGISDAPVVLYVGAVVRRKRPHILIEAVGRLKADGVECQLVIVGPEDDRAYSTELRILQASLGLEAEVVWWPFRQDIASVYQIADVFGLPSRSEGMPNSLLEAMASGVPCIGTPISGVSDLLVDGVHGRVVQPDADAFADAIRQYLEHGTQAKVHGMVAREFILERFSCEAVVNAYASLFRKIIENRG